MAFGAQIRTANHSGNTFDFSLHDQINQRTIAAAQEGTQCFLRHAGDGVGITMLRHGVYAARAALAHFQQHLRQGSFQRRVTDALQRL